MVKVPAHKESAAGCYFEMSLGRSETPEYQSMSFGDNPSSSATPKTYSTSSMYDGPFGGKKPEGVRGR
jgi:hypothetical protein